MKEETVYVMPFSHMDLYWAGSEEDCLTRGNRIISSAMQLSNKYPKFRFFIELAVFVDYFARTHPEKLDQLRALVKSGKIEVGAEWSGIHQCVNDGESLVRNTLYAWKLLKNLFGIEPKVVHPGDIPGFTPQYPQILSKTKIPYTFFTRAGPLDKNLFYWIGLDGSRALVWNARMYTLAFEYKLHEDLQFTKEKGFEEELKKIKQLSRAPVIVHWGFDLAIPPEQLIRNIEKWNNESNLKLEIITPHEYFERAEYTLGIPQAKGQIPSYWPYYEPCYAHITPMDIPALYVLLSAEKFTTIAYFLGHIREYPSAQFENIWKNLLKSLDHNRDACGEVEGDARMKEYKQRTIYEAGEILRQTLQILAEQVKVAVGDENAFPIVVFNPLSWSRKDVVENRMTLHGKHSAFQILRYNNLALYDPEGKEVPFQRYELLAGPAVNLAFSFTAKDVPPLGYKSYFMVPVEEEATFDGTCVLKENMLENEYYRLKIDPNEGEIDICDKKLGAVIVRGMKLLGIEENEKASSHRDDVTGKTFGHKIEEITLAENGPVRATLLIKGKMLESAVTQEITLYKELKRIDIKDYIDWHARTRLRIQHFFPVKVENPRITYGVPFGACHMEDLMPNAGPEHATPAEMDSQRWGKMREVQKWISVWNYDACVTISTKPRSFEIEGTTLRANLVRGVHGRSSIIKSTGDLDQNWTVIQTVKDGGVSVPPELRTHSSVYPPSGQYTFSFSIHSCKGNWKDAQSYRKGWEFSHPPIPINVGDPVTKKTLPPEQSFFCLKEDNLILTAMKKAETRKTIVARFFETRGEATKANIQTVLDVQKARETDALERETKTLEGLQVPVTPFEIKTLELEVNRNRIGNG